MTVAMAMSGTMTRPGRRRFIAPARGEVDARRFAQPLFADYTGFADWMCAGAWPSIDALNQRMPLPEKRFVVQDRALLADGLHYETRIAEHGRIATRAENWHDLFNAMVWCRWPVIKQALNARQQAHVVEMGRQRRNRAQYALTQFDEAGVIVRVRDPRLLAAWDAHDWTELFLARAEAWRCGDIAVVAVIGHALLEHALLPGLHGVGKALVLLDAAPRDAAADDLAVDEVSGNKVAGNDVARLAQAIADGALLNDPLELRPLPLSGIPGWREGQDAAFYRDAPCFRPLRAGRVYPPPSVAVVGSPLALPLGVPCIASS